MIQCFKFIDYREATDVIDKLNQITGADSEFHSLETIGPVWWAFGEEFRTSRGGGKSASFSPHIITTSASAAILV